MSVFSDRPYRYDIPVRVSARADYAIRAMAELAASGGGLVKGERIADAQRIPLKFLLNILTDLRHARLVRSHRGSEGGFELARPAADISVADVIRGVEGSLSTVQNAHPDQIVYPDGAAAALREVWLAVERNIEILLASVSLADLARGSLPVAIRELAEEQPTPA